MKIKSVLSIAFAFMAFGSIATAQTNTNLFIKGTMNITYNTHQNPAGTKGIQDVYDINLNVANSVVFDGKTSDTPQIIEGMFSKSITQPRTLKYDVDCDVVIPLIHPKPQHWPYGWPRAITSDGFMIMIRVHLSFIFFQWVMRVDSPVNSVDKLRASHWFVRPIGRYNS